ncbi:MAG: hypothetical protein ACQCXQ_11655 [Verrucomicrobiales bacterium]|nr:hypothetical protein [Verrucomicrobiota bacterium JB025]
MSAASRKKSSKKDLRAEIEDGYWHYLLTEGRQPTSVYALTEQLGVSEGEFYKVASSFQALEASYWDRLVEETIAVLHDDPEYAGYPADQKLLAFFFTFISHAQQNRSRLVEFFPALGARCSSLKLMRLRFIQFARELVNQSVEEGTIADRKKISDYYPELLFEQFRAIVEFHRKDGSADFQDTDAFIEKTVRLGTDVARAGAFESAFDLGRFLLRRFAVPGK